MCIQKMSKLIESWLKSCNNMLKWFKIGQRKGKNGYKE
jgi:hypothetical protein